MRMHQMQNFIRMMLFRDHPEIRQKYAGQFRYVLVDEYQDTNFAQHSIVLQLTKEHQHVCVVGDDAQSIYSFRGANIDNILKFTQLYKGARLFKLEQNYRSTQTIVCAANSLIEKNSEQIRKEVFSEKAKGEPIGVFSAYSDVEEGEIVAMILLFYIVPMLRAVFLKRLCVSVACPIKFMEDYRFINARK